MRWNVPLFGQQGARACLPACARMVLAFYGIEMSEGELSRLMGKTRVGTPVLNVELLENAGFDVRVETGSFDEEQLRQTLDEGMLLIAVVRTGPLSYWTTNRPHAVVVVGYDENGVHLNDPACSEAPQIVSWSEFLNAWNRFGRFGVLIRRQQP